MQFSFLVLSLLAVLTSAVPVADSSAVALESRNYNKWFPSYPRHPMPAPHDLNDKKEAYKFVYSFWTAFMNPNDDIEAKKINSSFFTPDCLGRVSLTRNFIGDELNTEYIFGLFSNINPVIFRMIGVPINFTIVNFLFDDNFVTTSVISTFYVSTMDFYIPVQIDLWYQLDGSNGKNYSIAEYDAVFRYFDEAFNKTNLAAQAYLEAASPHSNATGEQMLKALAIESICTVALQYCTGDNLQYTSYDECTEVLNGKRIGESFEGGRDTIFCRNVHQVMLPFRPSVHCPHVGPSGGDMCRDNDTTYEYVIDTYTSYFTNLFMDEEIVKYSSSF